MSVSGSRGRGHRAVVLPAAHVGLGVHPEGPGRVLGRGGELLDAGEGRRQPQPEGQLTICGWMPGSCSPAEPGEFAVLVDVGNDRYFRTYMRWDGTVWMMIPSRQAAAIPPSWWLRLPPEPEKGEGAE